MKLIYFILLFSLVGCQPTNFQAHELEMADQSVELDSISLAQVDGPPFTPARQSYPAVVPKAEPASRYGNRATYQVGGIKYDVLPSSEGYRATGLASWYGRKFHSKKTSSGDVYDLHGMTAAHKTLPLPTYVKVKNLENDRELIVKVNDRGPFHKNRIIDLSYGAASKLGILAKGTASVEIEAIIPSGVSTTPLKYYIQAGAFTEKMKAEALAKKILPNAGQATYIERHDQFYIVKTGPFSNPVRANKFKKELAEKGIQNTFSVLQSVHNQDKS